MTRPIPPYLRIHVEEAPGPPLVQDETTVELGRLCAAYERATGWPLRFARGTLPVGIDRAWSAPADPGVGAAPGYLAIEPPSGVPGETAIELRAATDLGASLAAVVSRMLRAESALAQREAELAAGVPVTSTPNQRHLARRLEAALEGGARALDCQAAGLYLLDADTTYLKLRSAWGLPRGRLADPPRKLATAMADLEALLGHAVVLSDTRLFDRWNPPEDFASAVCVPVSSPTTPLGTLWFFSTLAREFDERQTNVAELVAGRIAADLEREMLLTGIRGGEPRQLEDAAAWQRKRLPAVAPLIEGYQVAGWHRGAEGSMAGEFFDWWVMPSGDLAVSLGDALQRGVVAGMAAAALREQVRTCGLFLVRPGSIVERIGQLLWTSSAGDQFAALAMARLTPESGRVEAATGGPVSVLHVTRDGCRLLGTTSAAVGTGPDQKYHAAHATLAPGEAIVIASDGAYEAADAQGRPLGAAALGEALRSRLDDSAAALAEAARTTIESHAGVATDDRTVIVVKRRD